MKRVKFNELIIMLCLTVFVVLSVPLYNVSAVNTDTWLQSRFAYLETVLPTGKYWNEVSGCSTITLTGGVADYTTKISSSACPSHTSHSTCGAYRQNGGSGTALSWQCFGFTDMLGYYLTGQRPWGNWNQIGAYEQAQSYSTKQQIMNNLVPGDIFCYHVSSSQGHKVMVTNVNGDTISIVEANYGGNCKINRRNISRSAFLDKTIYYCLKYPGSPTIKGREMTTGNNRVLPDGDYAIVSAKDAGYILAAVGGEYPAQNQTNVHIYGVSTPNNFDVAKWDAWTITYSDGFYWIRQKDTSMDLTVYYGSVDEGGNVNVAYDNGSSAQRWAISYAYDGSKGYRIQAKCSGFSLNVADGIMTSGTNVDQYTFNGSDSQGWVFIPFKPVQTLAAGRYILESEIDDDYELDVQGDTGDIENPTNVQIWNHDTAAFYEQGLSRYNSFDVVPLDNGYYRLVHVASGKELSSLGGGVANYQNIGVSEANGHSSNEWAITPDGYNGGYILRAKCSGLALDVADGVAANGTNVRQHWYNGAKAQTWRFVPAEYTVSYNANGGSGAPGAQTKYYKGKLTLSEKVPTRQGYYFDGWAVAANANSALYQPGDVYSADENRTLYAVWRKSVTGVTLDKTSAIIEKGKTLALNATVTPNDAVNKEITWMTSNPDVATISETGVVTAKADGTAMILVTTADGAKTATCTVTVKTSVTGVTLNKTSAVVKEGSTLSLAVTVSPNDATNKDVTWTSSNPDVAEVSSTGVVTARSSGTATITVSPVSYYQTLPTATCQVTVLGGLMLPDDLIEIGEEAFEGIDADVVVIPGHCEEIGRRAFADCSSLTDIYIPKSVVTISRTAFAGCDESLVIHGAPGSVAQSFAETCGFFFEIFND